MRIWPDALPTLPRTRWRVGRRIFDPSRCFAADGRLPLTSEARGAGVAKSAMRLGRRCVCFTHAPPLTSLGGPGDGIATFRRRLYSLPLLSLPEGPHGR